MNTNLKKWSPWNWFKKEQTEEGSGQLPVSYEREWYPLGDFHREIDRMFNQALQRFGFESPAWTQWQSRMADFLKPQVDINEGDKSYRVTVEIPGVEPGDVNVSVKGDTLTISGEKKHVNEDKDENVHRIERSYGSFKRVLSLPDDADPEQVKANFKNGVLTLTIEKSEKVAADTRRIEVVKE